MRGGKILEDFDIQVGMINRRREISDAGERGVCAQLGTGFWQKERIH